MNTASDGFNRNNADSRVISGFGDEWSRFSRIDVPDYDRVFFDYFHLFPWTSIGATCIGFDAGCGTGRWAKYVAPHVGKLWCIDASEAAIRVARENLKSVPNVEFACASVESLPLGDETADFGYSLGVLHHVPDPLSGLTSCVRKLKQGSPFLVYRYYAFDNKPAWYRLLWCISESIRRSVSRTPHAIRYVASQFLACFIYWPLARLAKILGRFGIEVDSMPLSYYRDKSFYVIRTDALDRFGTRIEHRFTRDQIRSMLETAGLENIIFSDTRPYWCAVGYKR